MKRFLVLPHIKIQSANALSSPYTIGVPSIPSFLGAVHALERKLNDSYPKLIFSGAILSFHDVDLKVHKGPGDYVSSLICTANPVDKNGARPAFIEEGFCDLEMTMAIEYDGLGLVKPDDFLGEVAQILQSGHKISSGSILDFSKLKLLVVNDSDSERQLKRVLMPGYVLVSRSDLAINEMENGSDGIDALLNHLALNHSVKMDGEKVVWGTHRQSPGWIVPISVGYQGVSGLGKAMHQRDDSTPHRFVENVVTLGEFVMPHRIEKIDNAVWRYNHQESKNLYLCINETGEVING